MQREWREDDRKCTFIILSRDLIISEQNGSADPRQNDGNVDNGDGREENRELKIDDIPPPPQFIGQNWDNEINVGTKKSYPHLIETTIDAMIGDINLFLSDEELECNSDEEQQQQHHRHDLRNHNLLQNYDNDNNSLDATSNATPKPVLTQAELDIMIAKPSHRNKNLGTELCLQIMHYGASQLNIKRYFVKIHESNTSSLKLFREKLGFVQCAYAECFGELELEVRCKSSGDMVKWVERRWRNWRDARRRSERVIDDCADHVVDHGVNFGRIYDIYQCPLNSDD